jgi:Mlc titration factor MtfA (ptsG expression regulator)
VKEQLHCLVNVFIAEKKYEGCGGLEITDEIRITIAAQASMLLLNRKAHYFSKLHTILVYPHTYAAKTVSSNGMVTIKGQSVRLGESWQNGPVVLAWNSVTGGTMNIADARNVVLHEFAHQLDQEDGSADGAPILERKASYVAWARVLSKEYEALQKKKKKRRKAVMSKYGATNPAEFFAVATETFFEKSKQMKKRHPELYDELKNYYKLDPVEWL